MLQTRPFKKNQVYFPLSFIIAIAFLFSIQNKVYAQDQDSILLKHELGTSLVNLGKSLIPFVFKDGNFANQFAYRKYFSNTRYSDYRLSVSSFYTDGEEADGFDNSTANYSINFRLGSGYIKPVGRRVNFHYGFRSGLIFNYDRRDQSFNQRNEFDIGLSLNLFGGLQVQLTNRIGLFTEFVITNLISVNSEKDQNPINDDRIITFSNRLTTYTPTAITIFYRF